MTTIFGGHLFLLWFLFNLEMKQGTEYDSDVNGSSAYATETKVDNSILLIYETFHLVKPKKSFQRYGS